ncbi:MAG TPA: hypothetical protein VLD63_08635 [Anaerolineales bacterium]|nr:hypothetical protein [Anaerolineales bacterium]
MSRAEDGGWPYNGPTVGTWRAVRAHGLPSSWSRHRCGTPPAARLIPWAVRRPHTIVHKGYWDRDYYLDITDASGQRLHTFKTITIKY